MRSAVRLSLVLALAACGGEPAAEPADDPHAHEHHAHRAPHGGSLQVLGEEFAHVELVLDPATGRLIAYVLDGEAENPVRVAHPALRLTIGGETIELAATAAALTGETVGDTSQFEVVSGKLRGMSAFEGTLETITARGVRFDAVRVAHPGGNEDSPHAGR